MQAGVVGTSGRFHHVQAGVVGTTVLDSFVDATIIELETGLVIDTHIMSNYCFICVKGLATSDANYDAWYNNHRTVYQKNFSGLSHACRLRQQRSCFRGPLGCIS